MEKRKYTIFGLVFGLSLLADQLTKVWARASLAHRRPITIIEGFFDFTYSENPGAAFGIFRNFEHARFLLFPIAIVALVIIFMFLRKVPAAKLRIAGELGLLAGGAVGNIIDRMRFGKVTDFVLWHLHEHQWPVFNVADAALVVGVIGLLIDARGDELDRRTEAVDPIRPIRPELDAPRKRRR